MTNTTFTNTFNPYDKATYEQRATERLIELQSENNCLRAKLHFAEMSLKRERIMHWGTITALAILGINLVWVLLR